jgi:hypothetical protein
VSRPEKFGRGLEKGADSSRTLTKVSMTMKQTPDKKQKKRGSWSRAKSTPKEEGGGDKSELENS